MKIAASTSVVTDFRISSTFIASFSPTTPRILRWLHVTRYSMTFFNSIFVMDNSRNSAHFAGRGETTPQHRLSKWKKLLLKRRSHFAVIFYLLCATQSYLSSSRRWVGPRVDYFMRRTSMLLATRGIYIVMYRLNAYPGGRRNWRRGVLIHSIMISRSMQKFSSGWKIYCGWDNKHLIWFCSSRTIALVWWYGETQIAQHSLQSMYWRPTIQSRLLLLLSLFCANISVWNFCVFFLLLA